MLARAEMLAVFVPGETISLGRNVRPNGRILAKSFSEDM